MLALKMTTRGRMCARFSEESSFSLKRFPLPVQCSPLFANASRRFFSAPPARTDHVFAIPTYRSVFERVLRCSEVQLSLLRAFIPTLDIQYSQLISVHFSDHLNDPSLLRFLNDEDTLRTFETLSSRDDLVIKTFAREGSPPTVDRKATVWFKKLVKNFEQIRAEVLERHFSAKGFCFTCKLRTGEQVLVNLQVFPTMFSDHRALIHLSNFASNYLLMTAYSGPPIQRLIGIYILGEGEGGATSRASSHPPLQPVPLRHLKIEGQLQGGSGGIAQDIDLIQYSVTAAPAVFDREQSDWMTFFTRAQLMTEADVAHAIHTAAVLQAFESVKFSNLPSDVLSSYKAECEEFAPMSRNTAG